MVIEEAEEPKPVSTLALRYSNAPVNLVNHIDHTHNVGPVADNDSPLDDYDEPPSEPDLEEMYEALEINKEQQGSAQWPNLQSPKHDVFQPSPGDVVTFWAAVTARVEQISPSGMLSVADAKLVDHMVRSRDVIDIAAADNPPTA